MKPLHSLYSVGVEAGFRSPLSRKRRAASIAAGYAGLTAARGTATAVAKLVTEERAIAAIARDVAGTERITEREQLEAIHAFVGDAVGDEPGFRLLPRPLLRDTAIESLRKRRGFCGESARVAVLMLGALGVRANRIYLIGARWNHVIVEHRWADGGWYMFDAFPDPATQMRPDQLCSFSSEDPTSYPNAHDGNPWVDYYRWRPMVVRGISKSRPPAGYVTLTERPDMIRAGLGAVGAGGILAAGALAARAAHG